MALFLSLVCLRRTLARVRFLFLDVVRRDDAQISLPRVTSLLSAANGALVRECVSRSLSPSLSLEVEQHIAKRRLCEFLSDMKSRFTL